MVSINLEKCIECGSCAPFCKNEAIGWIDRHYEIDQSKCKGCGTCREYCPIDNAILETETEATLQAAIPGIRHS